MEHHIIKGEKVPSLGLGTWRLTGAECAKTVKRALALGYRHLQRFALSLTYLHH
jgi:2,5-diketo-D-gluconate reductase B